MVKDFATVEAHRLLADVHSDFAFKLKDGTEIKNLKELYAAIQYASSDVFSHHVTSEKNDFGNWVKDVHKDYKLANSLFDASTKEDCAKAIKNRISEIENALSPKESVLLLPAPEEKTSPLLPLEERLLEENDPEVKVSEILKEIEELSGADLDPMMLVAYKKPLFVGAKASLREFSSVFTASAWRTFADDIKMLVSTPEKKEFVLAVKDGSGDDKKDMMISHLKKVYR